MNRSAHDRLAVVVHEVRSPVAALAAISEALAADEIDSGDMPRLVSLAVTACRAIERLVGDAAPDSLVLEDVDAGRLVQEAAAVASVDGSAVCAVVLPGLPVLRADPVRIRQALDNLVANALAHSQPGEQVVVSARYEDGVVSLSVADAGVGIAQEEQDRIFEPGVRLDLGRSGSGLGLAVARTIAEAHGGALTVRSVPGRGATFTLSLPDR